MKVLFLLSSWEPAGSETYCVALAKAWQGRHEIHWISDRLHYGQSYISLPISQKAIPGGLKNTLAVRRYIKDHGIELVHSHSRRAHWVAAQAAAWAKIPHVTTIHQPPPVHFFSRAFPCLGDHAIAIDEVIVEHLARVFRRAGPTVHLIRNGIELDRFPLALRVAGTPRRILFLGRLTGGRWPAFLFFLDVLMRIGKTLPPTLFQIAGRIPPERADAITGLIQQTSRMIAPSSIEAVGWTDDLPSVLAPCDGVIAGGRSALESLASGKPVVLLGEGGILGLCTADSWPDALRTNLGDHLSPPAFRPAPMEVAVRELLGQSEALTALGHWGRMQVEKYYDIRNIAEAVDQVYQKCLISLS